MLPILVFILDCFNSFNVLSNVERKENKYYPKWGLNNKKRNNTPIDGISFYGIFVFL